MIEGFDAVAQSAIKEILCLQCTNTLQAMCDKYRLPFVENFHSEQLAQCYEVLCTRTHNNFKIIFLFYDVRLMPTLLNNETPKH